MCDIVLQLLQEMRGMQDPSYFGLFLPIIGMRENESWMTVSKCKQIFLQTKLKLIFQCERNPLCCFDLRLNLQPKTFLVFFPPCFLKELGLVYEKNNLKKSCLQGWTNLMTTCINTPDLAGKETHNFSSH